MGIVKLALSGLAGMEASRVRLGSALAVYDPQRLTPEQIAEAVNRKTPFQARVTGDREHDPEAFAARDKGCWLLRWFC